MDAKMGLWGVVWVACMYLVATGAWLNPWARARRLWGWALWLVGFLMVWVAGMAIEVRMGVYRDFNEALSAPKPEKHWIIAMEYLLLSIPAGASVLLRQAKRWARIAVVGAAVLLFAPMGMMLEGSGRDWMFSLGMAMVLVGILWAWSEAVDAEPSA
ncbi:MAG: hypothetical protein D6771_08060 [Zetaproteobacteria bacterium]|nr:MAG: hypothetical protein D6771_08060 [Zetaproteobacteria bacterium]